LEALCYRCAWLVTGQSKGIVDSIAERFQGCRTLLLSNGVDTSRFHPSVRTESARALLGPPDSLVVLYAGLHGLAQGLEQVLTAAQALSGDTRIRFVLLGDGPEKAGLIQRAAQLGLHNVVFLDPRPAAEIPALLAASDVVLVALKLYLPGAVPSKLYEAMASARAVMVIASGEALDIVQKYEAGIAVQSGDTDGLIEGLRTLEAAPELRHRMGQNGRLAAETHFNRTTLANSFIDHLEASHIQSTAQDLERQSRAIATDRAS